MMIKAPPIKREAVLFDKSPSSFTSSSSGFSFPSSTSSDFSKRLENHALSVAFQCFETKLKEPHEALESDDEDADLIAPFKLEDLGRIGVIADAVVEAGSGRVSPRIVDESRPRLNTPASFFSLSTSSPRSNANPVSPRGYSKEVPKNLRASLPEGRKSFQPLELSHTAAYPAQKMTVPAVQEERFVDYRGFFTKRTTNSDNVSLYNHVQDQELQFDLSL